MAMHLRLWDRSPLDESETSASHGLAQSVCALCQFFGPYEDEYDWIVVLRKPLGSRTLSLFVSLSMVMGELSRPVNNLALKKAEFLLTLAPQVRAWL